VFPVYLCLAHARRKKGKDLRPVYSATNKLHLPERATALFPKVLPFRAFSGHHQNKRQTDLGWQKNNI